MQKSTKNRGRVLVATLAAFTFVAAACGSDDAAPAATPAPAPDAAPDAPAPDASDEEIDLLIWASRDYYRPPDLWEGFMAENPNITVTVQVESNDDILQQMQRMQDAGQRLPDVIQDDTFLIEAYQNAGLLLDHTEQKDRWQSEDPATYDALLPIAWEENEFGDGIYGVSLTANFDVIYYNVAVCTEAAVDCAGITTLDEFLDAMRAVKASGSDAIPLTVQAQPGTGVTTLKTFFSAAGAAFDGAVPDMQSEGGQYTLNWFIQASAEGLLPPEAVAWGEDEARAAFAGQRAAFILDGFTVAGEFNEIPGFGLGDGWGVVPSPTRGEGNQISNARSWAITSATPYPYEAMLAIRHVNKPEQLVAAAAGGSVPMRNTAAFADPELDVIWPFFDQNLRDAYLGSDSVPAGLNGGEVELELEKLWGEIVSGSVSDSQALADKYQPILDGL